MKSKKAVSDAVSLPGKIVLALFLVFISIAIFLKFSGQGFANFRDQITLTGDCDGDTVIDKLDECPCDTIVRGVQANKGCPEGYNIQGSNIGKEDRSCLKDRKLCITKPT
ncbi:MAG: hypothetical protein AABX33_07895 [Nanoarchaeota archaeon]